MKKDSSFLRSLVWMGIPALAVALLLWGVLYAPHGQTELKAPIFPRETLTIQRADGTQIPFNIEVATTPAQHEYGLMFRKDMPHDSGMLFVWPVDQPQTMWMKNTLISLDMVYVGRDGTISQIIPDAQPLSLKYLTSDMPVHAVIEINGGEAVRQNIKVGDRVLHPAFSSPP